MATLVEAGDAGHALAIFDALPSFGLVADTATLNVTIAALDLRAPSLTLRSECQRLRKSKALCTTVMKLRPS